MNPMADSNQYVLDVITNVMNLTATPLSGWILSDSSAIVKYYTCDPISTSYREFYSTYGNTSHNIVPGRVISYAPSRKKLAVFRDGSSSKETILEIWIENRLSAVKLLKDVHNQIITNAALGYITWNSEETSIAYVAEKLPKPKGSFWSNAEGAGQDHYLRHDFGESMQDITDPRIFIYNLITKSVITFEPPKGMHPAQPVFQPGSNKVIFVGYFEHQYAMGLQYMHQKPTKLYEFDLVSKEIKDIQLTEEVNAACMPRFTPDGKLMSYFGVPKESTTHCMSMSLNVINYADRTTQVLLQPVKQYNEHFNGINAYHDILIKSNWLNNTTFAFSTVNRLNEEVYLIDLSSNLTLLPSNLSNPSYSTILDIHQDLILTYSSNINTPYLITLSTLTPSLSSTILSSGVLNPCNPLQESISNTLSSLKVCTYSLSSCPIENILYYSNPSNPLIVSIHGGPHFYSYLPFNISRGAILSLGYNMLLVNYRGTLGYGQDLVETLRGYMGTIEIEDVVDAIQKAGEYVSIKEVISYGASYGGYISSFLAASGKVNYAIVLNGLADMLSALYTSDISGMLLETSLNSEVVYHLDNEKLVELYRISPISVADRIEVPVFLMGGGKDVRVPSHGTVEMYRILKGCGNDVTAVWYENEGHDVAGPCAYFDLIAKILCWLREKRENR